MDSLRLSKLPSSNGRGTIRKLLYKQRSSNETSPQISEGMVPLIQFQKTYRSCNSFSMLDCFDMVLANLFEARLRFLRFTKFYISSGIAPLSLFNCSLSSMRYLIEPNSVGIVPVKGLSMKLALLRLGSNASSDCRRPVRLFLAANHHRGSQGVEITRGYKHEGF